jgi:hypothetical protein
LDGWPQIRGELLRDFIQSASFKPNDDIVADILRTKAAVVF